MQNSPGANPILGGWRGGCAGPAGPPVLTPGSPSGAGRGARRLPEGQCPPALLTSEDSVCGVEAVVVQNSLCSLHPLQKTSLTGCLPPTQLIGAKGWGKTLRHSPRCLVGWPGGL